MKSVGKTKEVQWDVNLIYHPGCSDQGNSWADKRSMLAIQLSVTFSVTSINLDYMHMDTQREWHTPLNYNFTYDKISIAPNAAKWTQL